LLWPFEQDGYSEGVAVEPINMGPGEECAEMQCEHCGELVEVTEQQFRAVSFVRCTCGGKIDVAHARRHASWEEMNL
jgi:hypothetical protein